VALLALLGLFLLANVMIPQRSAMEPEDFARLALQSRWHRFFLVTLGFGNLATSPIFAGVLLLFFVNLLAVLGSRARATWKRSLFRPRSPAALEAWAGTGEGLSALLPTRWSAGEVVETLRGFGFRVRRVGDAVVWGVKHRTAPLGFLVFHLSFLLFAAGGLMLWATRFAATAVLTEGQELGGELGELSRILRRPPLTEPPRIPFGLLEVTTRFERGEPTHLEALLAFPGGVEKRAWVNHPARWGSTSVLVQRAGLAPVLWLQDSDGFTRDRVAVAATTRGEEATEVALADGALEVRISPLGPEAPFPSRKELARTSLEITVIKDDATLFAGALSPGDSADLGEDGRLVLEELRLWAGVLVISERGGGLLIAGFVLGVAGLIWRLLTYRREVAVLWNEKSFTLLGRGEYFEGRFQEEMQAILRALGEEVPTQVAGEGGDPYSSLSSGGES
jgi:hypothetical protein